MGGGGFDWQDREEQREREALAHRCRDLSDYSSEELKAALAVAQSREANEAEAAAKAKKAAKAKRIAKLRKELKKLENRNERAEEPGG